MYEKTKNERTNLRNGARKMRAMMRGESCPPAIWIARSRMLNAKTMRPRSDEERPETTAAAPEEPKSRRVQRVRSSIHRTTGATTSARTMLAVGARKRDDFR